jgi:hypothetical protein
LKNISLIIALLNGNLIFPRRKVQFKDWLDKYNKRVSNSTNPDTMQFKPIDFIDSAILPTFKDSWITGITDSEGNFNISFNLDNGKYYPTISYSICQKWNINKPILEYLIQLFGVGSINPDKRKEVKLILLESKVLKTVMLFMIIFRIFHYNQRKLKAMINGKHCIIA